MKILITNDDGIYSDGIYALSKALSKLGEVTVVAPDSERSSVGHGITLSHPIWFKKINRKSKFFGYAVSGTPADCTKFALDVIMKDQKPDFVVSGINHGPNDGCSVFYSGTIAGAREAAMMNIPAMAISYDSFTDTDFTYAANCAAKLVKKFQKIPMPKATFLNVNVPAIPKDQVKGFRFTQQGTVPINASFKKRVDPFLRDYYWMSGKLPKLKNDNSADTYALKNKYVTVTPVLCDSTDHAFLNQLQTFND